MLQTDIILEMAESEWRAKLAQSNDIDDISEVFRALFNEPPSSGSPFFKDTFTSQVISLDKLVPREEPNPERVKRAHAKMSAAKAGTGEKRSPVKVFDMGNGKFKVLDGNTTLQALKELGETEVVVEVKKSLKQQVSDSSSLDAVYEQAEKALPTFKEWVEKYGQQTGASQIMLRPGLKGMERAGAKVKNDYAGVASRLTDIVGGTLLFDTVEQVVAAYKTIIQDKAVYKAKNRFEKPTSDGYRDIMMVVNVGGHLCELQLNTHAILDAKEKGLGHKLYEITRELEPIAKQSSEDGDFDFVAQGYIDALRKVSVKVYRNAAMSSSSSSASSMASDSETLEEFNRILARLSGSSISDHFSGLRESIRKMSPVNFSIAKGTSSFSTKSNMSDFMSGIPPFDAENITRNGKKVNAKVLTGRLTRAYLNDGSLLKLQYAIVDAASLVTSHNTDFTLHPEFPQELQPRDRTRDTMRHQIASIAGKLNPDLLGGSLYASVGSPIVGRDLVVESGNGRTMGIKTRYERDDAPHYREWLINEVARKIGIDAEQVLAMERPVLVRIRLSDEDRTTVTERANEGDIASMSPMEQAKVDSRRLTEDDLEVFRPSDDGDITAASNRQFVQNFIKKLGPAESAGLLTADSRPTKKLVDRIQASIFSKAYDNDKLLALMAEETHPTIKNILTALTLASPVFAKIRGIAPDMGGIDLTEHVVGAAMLILKSRDESAPIEMILNQIGMFEQIPEETKAVARLLHANMRSAKRMGNVFKMAGQKILTYLQNRDQISMFGAPEKPTAVGVLKEALSGEEADGVKQRGLFESATDTVMYRCSAWEKCDLYKTGECQGGSEHTEYDSRVSICRDIRPYVPGGVKVWDEIVRADSVQIEQVTTEKEPWQMTREEWTYQYNEKLYQSIWQAIADGKDMVVSTHYRHIPLKSTEHIRIAQSGTIQIPSGRGKWAALTSDQVHNLAVQAGVDVDLKGRGRHIAAVEQAISEGKPVPDAVVRGYPHNPHIQWRLNIRNAKTVDDISGVFEDLFGVYLDSGVDDAVFETALFESVPSGNFVKAPNGSINFGQITPEVARVIKRQSGFIRMREGSIETSGEKHINRDRRLAQIRAAGYKDAVDLIYAISSGYTEIYKGPGRQLILVNSKKQPVTAYVLLEPATEGDYYDVKTAFPTNTAFLDRKELLWGDPPYHQRRNLAPSGNLSHSDSVKKLHQPDSDVNMINESADTTETWQQAIQNAESMEDIEAVFKQEFPGAFPPILGKTEYVDTGEKIGGARKDIWKAIMEGRHTLNVQDMEGMDSETASKLVTKTNVIQNVVDQFRDHDFEPGSVFMITRLFGSYAAKPDDTDQARANYVAAASKVNTYLRTAKTLNDFKEVLKQIRAEMHGVTMTPEQKAFDEDYQSRNRQFADMSSKHWIELIKDPKYQTSKKKYGFKRDAADKDHWAWLDGVRKELFPDDIHKKHYEMMGMLNEQVEADPNSARNQYRALGDRFVNAVFLKSDSFKKNLHEAKNITDYKWLEKESGKKIDREKVEKPKWERFVPDSPERSGGADRVFKPQDLIDTFGIRGVEYGNWMDRESSEHHTQMLGLSFMDLSDILGIPVNHVSHGGKLAIAFGARGSGNASAHYEPGKKAINMTKFKGGGSLAHEWGHFMDNIVNMVASGGKEQFSYATGNIAAQKAHMSKRGLSSLRTGESAPEPLGSGIPQSVKIALIQLNSAINQGSAGGKSSDAAKNKYRSIQWVDSAIAQGTDPQKIMDDAYLKDVRGKFMGRLNFSEISHYIHAKTGQQVLYDKKSSEFYARSAAMSKSSDNYWTRPHELFARAFEAYISDKMEAGGRSNSYLVSGINEGRLADYSPYPMGEERKRINAAMDQLISALKENQIFEKALIMETLFDMILEKTPDTDIDFTSLIRGAKTFEDIESVFKQVFGVTLGTTNPNSYQDPTSEYGVRVRGVKAREKINTQCRDILDHVKFPEDLTEDDKAILRQYSGKGGLTENSQYEYYTPAHVAGGIWDSLAAHGFQNGNVLDPCTGAGVFSGTKPEQVVVTGCDIDPVGSTVAAFLNPGDQIETKPFEAVVMETPDNTFDAIVGNVPFGDARGKSAHLDPEYKSEKRIERYFILRALDKVKPGGLCAFVVPINIVGATGSKWEQFRIACSKKAEFLGAHKLPSKTFSGQGTDTVVDVVVFKKHSQEFLDKIQDTQFETLQQANVVWNEFVKGKYWMGEGKPFIMGKFVPKVAGDRWSRETVDGDIDNAGIRSKLAARFNSRIDWDMLDVAEPIVRNYIEGDRRFINGSEHELISGQWVKVSVAISKNAIDPDVYGAASAEELTAILEDSKSVLKLTADQMWAAYKTFPDRCTALQKQAIEFAMSQSDDATRDQLFHGSIIGGMIGRYHQSVVDGTPDDSERLMIQDIVTSEISRYGHPKHNAKLNLTGESSRMYGLFMNAVDEHGNFSDLLAGTLETKSDSQYDSGNVQSIVEHLFNREGIVNIELEDIKRLYTGSNDLTLADIASDYDNLAITPELMIMPLGRFCSGDIYPKIQGMVDAMAGNDVDDRIKSKWRKQINEIDNRRIKTNPEDITFGLRQKWFSPEYVVNFLRQNGYPNVDYVTKREVEKEDPVTGKITVRMVAETDYDSPFGEYVGIDGKGFHSQFLKYLNGNNITSSVEENIVQYKNQAKILEENFDVFMKQNLDIAELGEQYNRKFNGFLAYDHDGSDLGLKDVSPQVKLHDYQNVAIRRMSEDGRGILGYDVGLGKTFSALGLIAYNNQMGRSKKTCIVVPDSVLENWYHSAKSFYGHTNDMLFVGYEPVLTKDGTVEQEVVLDEKGKAKINRHTGEIEYQDKLKKRNSKEDIFKKLWEIPMTNKKIVVMSKEKFGMIPMMAETKGAYAEKMLKKALISDANARTMVAENSQGVKISYDDAKDRDRLEGIYSDEGTKKSGELPYFEMMGFTDVITDESHLYKNSYQGGEKTSAIAYLPNAPSAKRSLDMNMKMNFIRDSNNGRGVYGLTATPVTNSPIEIFSMLSLVCDVAEFERFGVYTIDDFVRVFGDIQQVDKQKVSGEITKKDGLVGFQNLGGLRSVFHKYVLLKNADDVGLKLPPHEDVHDGVHLTSEQQETYDVLREMAKEAAKPGKKRAAEETLFGIIRNMDRVTTDMDLYRHTMTFVFRLEDRDSVDVLIKNLPKTVKVKGIDEETKEKITYDRGLTTDIRIEDGKYILVVPEEFETHVVTRLKQFGIKESDVSHPLMPKYAQLLENMKKELETGGKQLVFTEEKSQHDKIVRIMVNNIPMISEKIGIINAETASGGALQGISDSYNSGKLSVVIANKKAEVGVNLQKGTTAIHHLTLPWTPASIQQRNGRGIRQGNTAKGIRVYYYLGVGSFDQYRLDLLERKSNWIRDLFTGKNERAENANAFNADDYMDMLEADPEAAKQKRLEKLEQKRREEEDRERKRLSNQLQVLISITTALGGLTASQSDLQIKLTEKQADLEAKIKKIKAEMTTTTDDEKRLKASQKLVTEQQALKKATDRLAGLEQEFQQKQIDLEARRKQITGYMQGLANKKKLPFSAELIDHPENALVTLSGHVLAVGDTFENIKDGGVYRIKEIDLADKQFLTEPLTVQWGGKWHRNADTFLTLYQRVSYSQAELDTLVMLSKEHTYSDLMKYDKAFFVENAHRMKFSFYASDAFLMEESGGIAFFGPWNSTDKIVFPEPQDPDYRKLAALTAVKQIRAEGLSGNLKRTLVALFGDNYDSVLAEYRKNATETEILTAFANAYKKWFDSESQETYADKTTRMASRLIIAMRDIRADMFEALTEYDNRVEIGQRFNLLFQAKRDEFAEKVRAEEAEEERQANEALKAAPNYKEIPEAIAASFKKIGITVRVNPGNLNYRVSKYKSETAKPFSRWLFQDSAGVSGVLYKTKEILKARYGAKFFKDEGQFSGAWWHLPSNYSLDEIYKLLS